MKSMTGYGSYETSTPFGTVHVYMKGVNRKGFDLTLTIPQPLKELEPFIREWLSSRIQRGAVSLVIDLYADVQSEAGSCRLDPQTWRLVVDMIDQASQMVGWSRSETVQVLGTSLLSKYNLWEHSMPIHHDPELLKPIIEAAFLQFDAFRVKEGQELKRILLTLIQQLRDLLEKIEKALPKILRNYLARLAEKVQQLGVNLSDAPERWQMEVALIAERSDVCEEVDRLHAHLGHFCDVITNDAPAVGRMLDFLTQEMMREINTLMNKVQDPEISIHGVALKTCIERLREQLQNVE